MNKTLIGKENHLFLTNDSCRELEVHCNNLNLIQNTNLPHLQFDKYMIIIFPNKSFYYKDYLPDGYVCKYRPAFDIYAKKLQNKVLDGYNILKGVENAYYKTDTHINLKGNYAIYLAFIDKVNREYKLNLPRKLFKIDAKNNVELSALGYGIGDLTWSSNLGDQILLDKTDDYYFCNNIKDFYMRHVISECDIKFYTYDLLDTTNTLIGQTAGWDILSKYIIYKTNSNTNNLKVIIFYDSFLLSIISLYMELFGEVYMIKSVYDNRLIEAIKPDYVFEFRVERFLF